MEGVCHFNMRLAQEAGMVRADATIIYSHFRAIGGSLD